MITMVDETESKTLSKFGYTNQDGDIEWVAVYSMHVIDVYESKDKNLSFYVEDIDNLIKALQAAKDSLTKES